MSIYREVGNATIYLYQQGIGGVAINENLGEVPFEQVNILGDLNDTQTSSALQDIWNFTAAVNELTDNTYLSTTAKIEVKIESE